MSDNGYFVPINPVVPKVTPDTFRLPDGDALTQLRFIANVQESRGSGWRCCTCSKMQPEGSLQVWMEDSISRGDPAWSVFERNKRSAWNGSFSAWCVKCASESLPAKPTLQQIANSVTGSRNFFKRILKRLASLAADKE